MQGLYENTGFWFYSVERTGLTSVTLVMDIIVAFQTHLLLPRDIL